MYHCENLAQQEVLQGAFDLWWITGSDECLTDVEIEKCRLQEHYHSYAFLNLVVVKNPTASTKLSHKCIQTKLYKHK